MLSRRQDERKRAGDDVRLRRALRDPTGRASQQRRPFLQRPPLCTRVSAPVLLLLLLAASSAFVASASAPTGPAVRSCLPRLHRRAFHPSSFLGYTRRPELLLLQLRPQSQLPAYRHESPSAPRRHRAPLPGAGPACPRPLFFSPSLFSFSPLRLLCFSLDESICCCFLLRSLCSRCP